MHSKSPSPAELSSLSSSLDDLTRRVRQMAEEAFPDPDADEADEARSVAGDLWEVERLLVGARRRLDDLTR